ncbi:MAG: lipopolysaccharide heptosyltransferase II [candidate division Zixibacteria bacterium]|nr:lipopolysaccharide heptosyltransferase II [candidate division Zixibacteria bacterium]
MPQAKPHDPERILVVRTDRIGDVLLSTPVLSVLRARYPASHIAVLVAPHTLDAVAGHPAVNSVLTDDAAGLHRGPAGFWKLVTRIRNERFDTVLLLHPTARLAALCCLARIPRRVGTGYRLYSFLFNLRVYDHRREAKRHEVEYNLRLAEALTGCAAVADPYIDIPADARQTIDRRMTQWGVDPEKPVVVLHPGSGGSARNWPEASFAMLSEKLSETGIQVIVSGGPGEEALAQRVAAAHPTGIVADRMSLKELAALLSVCRLCVTNSTGPLHIAAGIGTPTVALFCPVGPCSPTRWGPFGSGHRVLKPDVPTCSGCIGEKCPYFDCMNRISVETVFHATQEILATSVQTVG